VSSENEADRQGLNLVSTRLHEAKTRLKFNVADSLSSKGLETGVKILEDIQKRMEEVRSLPKFSDRTVKYERNARKPDPRADNPEVEPKAGRPMLVRMMVTAAVLLFVVGGSIVWNYLSGLVVPGEIEGPIPIRRMEKTDDGFVLHVTLSEWDRLDEKQMQQVFRKVEDYMREKRVHEITLEDGDGQLLGAVIRSGQSYGRRAFREKGKTRER
jgi:hypothetical protein